MRTATSKIRISNRETREQWVRRDGFVPEHPRRLSPGLTQLLQELQREISLFSMWEISRPVLTPGGRTGGGRGRGEDRKQQVLTLHCWQEKLQPGLSVSYSHCSLLDIYLHLKSLLGAYILSYIFKLSMKIKVMEFNIKGGFVKTVGRIYWGASQDRRSVGAGRLQDSVTDSARSLGALVLTLTVKCSPVMLLLMFQQQEKHLMIE